MQTYIAAIADCQSPQCRLSAFHPPSCRSPSCNRVCYFIFPLDALPARSLPIPPAPPPLDRSTVPILNAPPRLPRASAPNASVVSSIFNAQNHKQRRTIHCFHRQSRARTCSLACLPIRPYSSILAAPPLDLHLVSLRSGTNTSTTARCSHSHPLIHPSTTATFLLLAYCKHSHLISHLISSIRISSHILPFPHPRTAIFYFLLKTPHPASSEFAHTSLDV